MENLEPKILKKSIPEISIESELLYKKIIKLDIDELITYEELSRIIGRNVRNEARGNLRTAMNKAIRENRMVFESVRGIGVKRLSDIGIVDSSASSIKHIRSASIRASKKLICVNEFNTLPNDKKIQHNATLSALGIIAHIGKGSSIKKLESKVGQEQAKLSLEETLKLFEKKKD